VPKQAASPQLHGAFNQGKKLFKGAVDYSNDRQIKTAIAAGLIWPVFDLTLKKPSLWTGTA
jgi:hypothetical protein